MQAQQLKGQRLRAQVKLVKVLYPKKHEPGEFAIAAMQVLNVLEGTIPDEFRETAVQYPFGKEKDNVEIIVKGNMPAMRLDLEYIFQGILDIDKRYGPGYNVEQLRLDYSMDTEENQRKFFLAFLTEKQVDALMAPGNEPLKWLEDHDVEKLKTVKGIGDVVAERMINRFEESKDYGRAFVELDGLGLTNAAVEKLVKRYGSVDTMVDKIKQNPYILIREVHGYGWEKADAIARRQGLTADCRERVLAYAQYYLEKEADDNGNSWIMIDTLLQEIAAMCYPVTKENLFAYIKSVMGADELFRKFADMSKAERYKHQDEMPMLYYETSTRKVGMFWLRLMEYDISRHLERLKNAPKRYVFTEEQIQGAIRAAEKEQGFEYDSDQKAAIRQIIASNVSILTGLAGCGKTVLLNAVSKLFRSTGMRLDQCALSGRASSKMSEVTKLPGKTIHRLLNYLPDEERFLYNADNWIPTDVIILDETSMVGGELFLQLVEAIPTGARFIMVGDHHQLEAIGLANVFKDCLSSGGYIPSSVLTKIHRQAAKSGIITESIRASNGERMLKDDFIGEETRGELQDFKIISSLDPSFTQRNILQEYRRLLAEGIDPNDIQIIVSQRTRGMISCRALNEAVQEIVNPGVGPGDIKVPYVDNGVRYFVTYKKSDKIIITKNNYHAKRPNQAKKKGDVQIFNGNVGYIEEINSEYMVVKLTEQGLVQIDRADWGDVSLAYAITCHKKQGDQVPYAIVGLDTSSYAMFSKEWVYTAITRASKYCAFVTTPLSINRAVKISRVKKKQTWLKAFLAQLRTAEITGKEIK